MSIFNNKDIFCEINDIDKYKYGRIVKICNLAYLRAIWDELEIIKERKIDINQDKYILSEYKNLLKKNEKNITPRNNGFLSSIKNFKSYKETDIFIFKNKNISLPIKQLNKFYDYFNQSSYDEDKHSEFINYNYDYEGILCYLVFKKTKTKEEISLNIACSSTFEEPPNKSFNVYKIIEDTNEILFKEIDEFVTLFMKPELSDPNSDSNLDLDIQENPLIVYVCMLHHINNLDKRNIFKEIYKNDFSFLKLNLLFKIIDSGKNNLSSSRFIFEFKEKIISFLNSKIYLKRQLPNNKGILNIETYNDKSNTKYLINMFIEKTGVRLFKKIENDKISIDKNKCVVVNGIKLNNIKIIDLLYSNFLDKFQRYGYNILRFHTETKNILLPDVIQDDRNFNNHILITLASKDWALSDWELTVRKDDDKEKFERIFPLLKILPEIIDWDHFTKNKIIDYYDSLDDLYIWFRENFKEYLKNFPKKAENISRNITTYSIHQILKEQRYAESSETITEKDIIELMKTLNKHNFNIIEYEFDDDLDSLLENIYKDISNNNMKYILNILKIKVFLYNHVSN